VTQDHSNPSQPQGQRPSLGLPQLTHRADPAPQTLREAFTPSPLETPAPVRSLYIHIPFCAHRCHYCDFYSIVDTRDRAEAFIERLIAELAAQAPAAHHDGAPYPLDSIFIGGGTPTLLPVPLWDRLLNAIDDLFDLAKIRSGAGEWTVECNPETAHAELFDRLVAGGINRLSMGAQSFIPELLDRLDRRHNPQNVYRALDLAQQSGIARTSIDLIFAIPGQTLEQWDADLRTAIDLGTTHLSAYNLTYEPNTPLTARLNRGEFEPTPEDLEIEMFEHTGGFLAQAGLPRYEVSNFAKPGYECRHNLAYWRQDPWLAAGPSASGHLLSGSDREAGSHRWKNTPRLDTYLQHSTDGFAPVCDYEPPEPNRLLIEIIMTGLRLAEGLDRSDLLAWAERLSVASALLSAARPHEDAGRLLVRSDRWVLSEAGLLFADGIASDLMASVYEA